MSHEKRTVAEIARDAKKKRLSDIHIKISAIVQALYEFICETAAEDTTFVQLYIDNNKIYYSTNILRNWPNCDFGEDCDLKFFFDHIDELIAELQACDKTITVQRFDIGLGPRIHVSWDPAPE